MKKKMMSLVAVGLAVSMLAGCGNAGTPGNESSGGVESSAQESKAPQEEESSEASGDTGEGTEGSGNVNEFGWEVPEETLVINILDAAGDYAPTEGEKAGEENVIKYFKEKFNVEFNIQHITGDGTEAVNLALASGDYPDIA